jgi:hypothetical protein
MVTQSKSARPLRRSTHTEIAGRFARAPYLAVCPQLVDELAILSGVRNEVCVKDPVLNPFFGSLVAAITEALPDVAVDPFWDPHEPADPSPEEEERLARAIAGACREFRRHNPRLPVCESLVGASDQAILRVLEIDGMNNTAAARLCGVGRHKVRRLAATSASSARRA